MDTKSESDSDSDNDNAIEHRNINKLVKRCLEKADSGLLTSNVKTNIQNATVSNPGIVNIGDTTEYHGNT